MTAVPPLTACTNSTVRMRQAREAGSDMSERFGEAGRATPACSAAVSSVLPIELGKLAEMSTA